MGIAQDLLYSRSVWVDQLQTAVGAPERHTKSGYKSQH